MTEMCVSAANYIINSINEYNEGKQLRERIFMSSKRLQKLLFFSDVLYMVENNGTSMFSDEFCAWPSGPVIPSVYKKFMQYQDGEMKPHDTEPHTPITFEMQHVIDRVLEDTNHLDTVKLVDKSHEKNSPWYNIYNEDDGNCQIISKSSIYDYYKKNGAPYGSAVEN